MRRMLYLTLMLALVSSPVGVWAGARVVHCGPHPCGWVRYSLLQGLWLHQATQPNTFCRCTAGSSCTPYTTLYTGPAWGQQTTLLTQVYYCTKGSPTGVRPGFPTRNGHSGARVPRVPWLNHHIV